jgi:cytochrome c553
VTTINPVAVASAGSDDTTNDFIMGGVAQTLDEESIQAIAAWLGSLSPERSL